MPATAAAAKAAKSRRSKVAAGREVTADRGEEPGTRLEVPASNANILATRWGTRFIEEL